MNVVICVFGSLLLCTFFIVVVKCWRSMYIVSRANMVPSRWIKHREPSNYDFLFATQIFRSTLSSPYPIYISNIAFGMNSYPPKTGAGPLSCSSNNRSTHPGQSSHAGSSKSVMPSVQEMQELVRVCQYVAEVYLHNMLIGDNVQYTQSKSWFGDGADAVLAQLLRRTKKCC